jgi:membrane fusion protein, multidrug efflux system
MANKEMAIPAGSEAGNVTGRSRPPFRWIIGLTLVLISIVAFVYYRKHSPPKVSAANGHDSGPIVTVASAHRGDLGQFVEAIGNVTPLATLNLYSQITGQIVGIHYHEGQIVHRGDPLIDIDPAPYEAQLKEAQGALERDQSVLRQAEMDMERYQKASSVDALARQTFEDQELAVEQDRGTVKNDLGQVQYAQAELGYCHMISPIDGQVGLRLVDQGNTVFAGSATAIVVVTQMQPITVVFDVAEDHLDDIRNAAARDRALPVDVYDRSLQTKIASGKLLTMDNQVDTSTGTVRLRASFSNRNLRLFPNQFVNAQLLIGTLHDVVLVPSDAVQHNGEISFIYTVVNGMVEQRPVKELATEALQTAVSGLAGNESVVTSGFERIQPGAKVRVQQSQAVHSEDTENSEVSSEGVQ